MYLIRLIYVSRMTEVCDTKALEQILKVSRKKNEARGITGALCFDPSFFLQCLEGRRSAVCELYADIVRDERHTDVTLLDFREIDERSFGDWSMAFLTTSDLDREVLLKYEHARKFDPFKLRAKDAHDFLVEIAALKRELLNKQQKKRLS